MAHFPNRSSLRAEVAGIALLAVLLGTSGVGIAHIMRGHRVPAEDAAMLMRYASNLAHGDGIRFSAGQHPVDGATDFGFMVMVAALIKLGLTANAAVVALDVVAALGTTVVVYVTARFVVHASVATSIVAAAFVALGPGIFYTEARFGTPVFGASVAAMGALAISAERQPSRAVLRGFAIAGLVTGLIRPEGVILFVLMVVALLFRLRSDDRKVLLKAVGLWFLPLGAVYFMFHWLYFGYPLPNPYYRKSGGGLHAQSLRVSLSYLAKWGGPLAVLYAAAVVKSWRTVVFYAIPIAGFSLAWVLLSNETNYLGRFQYPLLVLLALSLPALWETVKVSPQLDRPHLALAVGAFGTLALLGLWGRNYRNAAHAVSISRDSRGEVGANLRRLPGHHTMAVTEAGLLPLYSGWTALDMWGLNDESIAHHGLRAADLDRADPDLVMIHWTPGSPLRGWQEMENTALAWVTTHRYKLVADYGTPNNAQMYYVKPAPDSAAVEVSVRIAPYYLGTTLAAPDLVDAADNPGRGASRPRETIGMSTSTHIYGSVAEPK